MPGRRHAFICPRRFTARKATLVACSSASSPPPPGSDGGSGEESMSANAIFRLALLSGAVAGFTVDAVLFPLDTLKTRLQVASPGAGARSPAALLKGIYAGFGPAVLASAPAAAAFFGVYDYVKRRVGDAFPQNGEKYAPFIHVISAAAGDIASSTVRVPFEVVKQRLQSGIYATPMKAVGSIWKTEGVGGFFAGYGSLILRDLPFDAIQFPLYEFFKSVAKGRRKRELHTWETAVCGSMAGAIAATVTTPLDVVKTRLMTQTGDVVKYHGLVHGIRTVAREEGLATLMSGVVPRVMWISLGGAIFFGAYEAAKKSFTPYIARTEREEEGKKV